MEQVPGIAEAIVDAVKKARSGSTKLGKLARRKERENEMSYCAITGGRL